MTVTLLLAAAGAGTVLVLVPAALAGVWMDRMDPPPVLRAVVIGLLVLLWATPLIVSIATVVGGRP